MRMNRSYHGASGAEERNRFLQNLMERCGNRKKRCILAHPAAASMWCCSCSYLAFKTRMIVTNDHSVSCSSKEKSRWDCPNVQCSPSPRADWCTRSRLSLACWELEPYISQEKGVDPDTVVQILPQFRYVWPGSSPATDIGQMSCRCTLVSVLLWPIEDKYIPKSLAVLLGRLGSYEWVVNWCKWSAVYYLEKWSNTKANHFVLRVSFTFLPSG